ncbi:MAG: sodium:proton antiporter [Thermodesulfovibrionia bacterium]
MEFGEIIPLWSIVPFMGMLLSIAIFPLIAPRFWHHHFAKVSLFWALITIIPLLIIYRTDAFHKFIEIILVDYIPFIIVLTALYTVSGGILIKGILGGTPLTNTFILLLGTLLASWMGTTGASMLLIRPFIRANTHRMNRRFMVVFFIFLVSNIGGSLTPLGDPPLFLGFLRGVPFLWTFGLFREMMTVSIILLIIYIFMDTYYYRKEGIRGISGDKEPLRIYGTHNILLFIMIVLAVLISGIVRWGELSIIGVHIAKQDIIRDVILIIIIIASLLSTKGDIREENGFTWFPMKEVAILFAGIFITMMPCLEILKAGEDGKLSFIIKAVDEPHHYFWITGILSSFLDNAPTYLTFLNTVIGRFYPGIPSHDALVHLIDEHDIYLKAISLGAVFFGANTYIGNAPNFMVRSIAEESGISMPSFFGYMLKYSVIILIPIFILITLLFLR